MSIEFFTKERCRECGATYLPVPFIRARTMGFCRDECLPPHEREDYLAERREEEERHANETADLPWD